MDEIIAQFSRRQNVTVNCNYAASSMLAQQITEGAGADVFLSANERWVDYLQEHGLVARRQDLLGNRLVIIVPAESQIKVEKEKDLLSDKVRHLALADPQAVPAGIYAQQALTKLGLWKRLEGKVVAAADVRYALCYVETGAAEAGLVYATDAAITDSVKVVTEIDPALTEPIRYPIVLLTGAADCPAAESFYQYLTGPEAAEVFRKHGFEVFP